MVDVAVIFITHDESAEVVQPGDRAFDLPATPITTQLPSVLSLRPHSAATVRADQVPTFRQQAGAQLVAVVRAVGDQRGRPFTDRDRLDDSFRQRDLSRRSTFGPACEWNTLTIRHHHQLRTLSAFSFSDAIAPFFAGANVPSTNTSSQSNKPCSSSVSRNARQISSSTPSASQSVSLRQQVLGDGYRSGKSRHRAPLRNTQRIPSKQARSSTDGRPPRGERFRSGKNGLIRSHDSSVINTSYCRAIEILLSTAYIT